jgi:predicted phosphodiesterase
MYRMPTTRLIGDVHGKYDRYKKIIADVADSIQVGDMGVGFRRRAGYRAGDFHANPAHYAMARANHRFIRGNHDNPYVCRMHSQCIADGIIESDVMFIGGALSVDREWRTEGYDWWVDEELSIGKLNTLVDVYAVMRPRVMITHDCPETTASSMCRLSGRNKMDFPSRTRQALQSMLEMHQPDLWVFGHWHFSFDQILDGTRFICLAELEYKDIDIYG